MNQVYPGGNDSYPSTPPEPVVRWQMHAKTPYVTYFMIASCVLIFIAQYVTDATLGLDLPALYGMKSWLPGRSARGVVVIDREGRIAHHKAEALFKGFARALKMALRRDPFNFELPTTKGLL